MFAILTVQLVQLALLFVLFSVLRSDIIAALRSETQM
jgi:hypothetical protein